MDIMNNKLSIMLTKFNITKKLNYCQRDNNPMLLKKS